jgi:predicted nucleic acid-binding protein
MIVYVESNFVLELALEQEQSPSCEATLAICESGKAHLVLPMFCIAEPYETLGRRAQERFQIQHALKNQLKLFSRSQFYQKSIDVNAVGTVIEILLASYQEEEQRLYETLDRILKIAELIPLTREVLAEAVHCQSNLNLKSPDAIVYASVLSHLAKVDGENKCFLNRNSKDFDNAAVQTPLASYGCKMLFRFDSGASYIQSQRSSGNIDTEVS